MRPPPRGDRRSRRKFATPCAAVVETEHACVQDEISVSAVVPSPSSPRGAVRRAQRKLSWALVALAISAFAVAVSGDGAWARTGQTATLAGGSKAKRRRRWCPKNMVNVRGDYCIDRYEAYTAVMLKGGKLRRHSAFAPVDNKKVKALNRKGRMPQAYISGNQAAAACKNAGKRLCSDSEWVTACKGKRPTVYPYGKKWKPGRCNDQGVSSFNMYFGVNGGPAPQSAYTFENLNDPRLNKPKGTCAPAGRFRKCKNSFKVYDMVGNLHEWTNNRRGIFRGGYFLDVHENGDGCDYRTRAHNRKYHDYSTGFRCCKSLR